MRTWALALLISAATFVAYAPCLNGEFVWDDGLFAGNPTLGEPGGLKKIWTLGSSETYYYRAYPLTYSLYWLQRQLWGLSPFGFHCVNVALHAVNAVLSGLLFVRLRLPGAWLAAAIFALHPVHVESVAWISELRNVLHVAFYLLALFAYLRYEEGGGRRWYLCSLLLFLGSLLSKIVACTFPIALMLLEWRRSGKPKPSQMLRIAPFFLLAGAVGLYAMWAERLVFSVEPYRAEFNLSWAQKLILAGRALWFYPGKLLWPSDLAFSYGLWELEPKALGSWVPLAAAGLIGLWLAASRRRDAALALAFYAATIAPVLGFIKIYTHRYSYVADHYQYLASLGLILLTVGSARLLLQKAGDGVRRAAATLVLAALASATWRQAHAYRNAEALWRHTIRGAPGAFMAHVHLGSILMRQGRAEEAAQHYREAARLNPNFEGAHYGLGIYALQRGRREEALRRFKRALEIHPAFWAAAQALQSLGRLDLALGATSRAARLFPGVAGVRNNHAILLMHAGRLAEAQAESREALRLDPSLAAAHNVAGMLAARRGAFEEAAGHWSRALKLKPDFADAHVHLGMALLRRGRKDMAAAHFRAALRVDPGHEAARKGLEMLK